MSGNGGEYTVAVYFESFFSTGLDRYVKADTEQEAIKRARFIVEQGRGPVHCTITNQYGALIATVVKSKGRVYTKRAKR